MRKIVDFPHLPFEKPLGALRILQKNLDFDAPHLYFEFLEENPSSSI